MTPKVACLVAHAVEVLHREVVDVKKSLDAVGQACLLGLVELGVLDGSGNALGPAHLCQAVGFYNKKDNWLAFVPSCYIPIKVVDVRAWI